MATKTCPECDVEVPVAANRCKECFHDFTETKPRSAGPMVLLGAVAVMAVLGAIVFGVIAMRPLEERILVDEETKSVVFTTHYRSGPQTDRLKWDDIARLEHVTTAGGNFQIIAVTSTGDVRVIQSSSDRPLTSTAEHYAQVMDKPLDVHDNTRGFHKMSEE